MLSNTACAIVISTSIKILLLVLIIIVLLALSAWLITEIVWRKKNPDPSSKKEEGKEEKSASEIKEEYPAEDKEKPESSEK